MNRVSVVSLNNKYRIYEKKIKTITQKLLRLLKKKNCCLEIFLINSRKMKILNKKFRNPARKQASYGAGKNKTSSLLSFAEPKNFPHPESKLKPLGEIYLNADSRGLHADKCGKSLRKSALSQRLSALLAHGLLHLMGFQHKKKSDRIKMEETEQKLLRQNPKP